MKVALLVQQLRGRFEARSSWLVVVWLFAALVGFASYANGLHRLDDWLSLFLLRAWIGALGFGIASFAAGLRVLALLKVRAGTLAERSTMAVSVGVLTFALGIYVFGLLGLLGLPFFFLWPALLLLFGGRALARYLRQFARIFRTVGPPVAFPQSLVSTLAVLLIFAGAFGLYVQVISPNNVSFDARWYHLPIAETYAAAGRIWPFPEGWYLGAYPHLASWLYTWAFLAPGQLRHHLCLVAHLEFFLLLATVVGASALAARLISGPRLRYGGAALFLFPGIFVFDSNLNGGSDHALAFWAAPLGLALLHYLARPDARRGVLLGMMLGAATLTKYQAIYFIAAIGSVLIVELIRSRQLRSQLIVIGVAFLVSSPHWLKNWIAYGDPIYPNLYRWLPDHPLFPGAVSLFERSYWFSGAKPTGSAAQKALATAQALIKFSFFPKAWARIPDGAMVFGSLFTLLLPLVLWIRPRWRVLVIVACVHLSIAVWFLTYPYDRYLQSILPWMAACLAASLACAWRMELRLVRVGVVLLVALQMVWGGDAYFLRSQAMLGELPLRALSAADHGKLARTAYPGQELEPIGESLPKGARLVGHDFYQSLGVGAQLICDNPDWQGAIDYLQIDVPERVLDSWKRLGATHLVWPYKKEPRHAEDLARDTVFARAAHAFTISSTTIAGYRVAALVERGPRPAQADPTRIAWLACSTDVPLGIYTPAGLATATLASPLARADLHRAASASLAQVNAIWVKESCPEAKAARSVITDEFTELMGSGDLMLWIRR